MQGRIEMKATVRKINQSLFAVGVASEKVFKDLPTGLLQVDVDVKKTRTPNQQAAIECYCKRMAEALNDAGHYRNHNFAFLSAKTIRLKNSQETFKRDVWCYIQAQFFPETRVKGQVRTSKLQSHQVSVVFDNINELFIDHLGIHQPFSKNTGVI